MRNPAIPNVGPKSGGTNITVMGSNIGTGSSRRVLVGGKECKVTGFEKNSINCTTSGSDTISVARELVQVIVDNWVSELDGFSYVADPTFTSITPNIIFAL